MWGKVLQQARNLTKGIARVHVRPLEGVTEVLRGTAARHSARDQDRLPAVSAHDFSTSPRNDDTGASRGPVEPRQRIPDLSSMPPLTDLLRAMPPNNARLLDQLSGLNQQYGPFRIKITDANYFTKSAAKGRPGFTFMGVVYDDKENVVGTFGRKIYEDRKGKIVAYNNSLLMTRTRTGFATAFNTAMENYYRRCGVHRVELHAVQDGSYVFARQGFEFDRDRQFLRDTVNSIKARVAEMQCHPADRQLLSDILERFNGRVKNYPSPRELADLSGHDPALGETLMKGVIWRGVKFL